MLKRVLMGAALGFAVAGGALAQSPADSYPSKPVRIIVPFGPGGSVDILARAIGQKMTEKWGQPTVVETRGGAATMIGTAAAARSEPDGYTLIIVVSNHATNPTLQANITYDALKDFETISLLARTPVVVYAHPSLQANSLKELVALAKSKPGSLNFGSAGPGSMTHLVAEMLKLQAGIDMVHVVYRGGASAMTDLLGGHLPMQFATVAQALPQYQAGSLKALGVSSADRYAAVQNVPTFKEQGFDLVATEWYGLLAPAKTPRAIVDKLNAEMRRIIANENLGDRLTGIQLVSSTPEELREFITAEIDRWGKLIKQLGIKVE
jgi:tripartite-type tricarboxylate transporter receptor subunit TctC